MRRVSPESTSSRTFLAFASAQWLLSPCETLQRLTIYRHNLLREIRHSEGRRLCHSTCAGLTPQCIIWASREQVLSLGILSYLGMQIYSLHFIPSSPCTEEARAATFQTLQCLKLSSRRELKDPLKGRVSFLTRLDPEHSSLLHRQILGMNP